MEADGESRSAQTTHFNFPSTFIMSRFNTKTKTDSPKTTNLAGGAAYKESTKLEFLSLILSSFVKDQFYSKGEEQIARIAALIHGLPDKKFAAKAAIYARTQFGMRSITHVVAAELFRKNGTPTYELSGEKWVKKFIDQVIYRPDDALEILSYYDVNVKQKTFPKQLLKGIAIGLEKFTPYELAKYRGENKGISLVDIVNLSHPKPSEKNGNALELLVNGKLRSTDTWETALTAAGHKAGSEEEKIELKAEAWKSLIKERKLGYFALLRNLRNIWEQAPEVLPEALAMLTDEKLIKKSLVLPFRFTTAQEEIDKLPSDKKTREITIAINKAIEISLSNVPQFDGETLVVLDTSGSMAGKPSQIGSLFSAVLVKACNADLMTFATSAEYRTVNPLDSITTISQAISFNGGGTNFHAIFQKANKKYDRVIILSDMQGWIGYDTPVKEFNIYKKKFDCDPFIYSFDLQGYGTLQMPQENVLCLTGFSEKVFDMMRMAEEDENVLISTIEAIEL